MLDTHAPDGWNTRVRMAENNASRILTLSVLHLVAGVGFAGYGLYRTYVDWNTFGLLPLLWLAVSFMCFTGVLFIGISRRGTIRTDGKTRKTGGFDPRDIRSIVERDYPASSPRLSTLEETNQRVMTIRLTCAALLVFSAVTAAVWDKFI